MYKPLAILASLLSLTVAATVPLPQPVSHQAPAHIVHQFSNPTWIENLAVRQNGQIFATALTEPSIYLLDPILSSLDPQSPRGATLIHSFLPEKAVLGITETQADHFFVIVGNASLSSAGFNFALGTYAIYSVDLTTYNPILNSGAKIHLVTTIPEAGLLNGLATLDAGKDLIIATDSIHGIIWLINVQTGKTSKLLSSSLLLPTAASLGLGANGLRVLLSKCGCTATVYISNLATSILYSVDISLSTLAVGPLKTIQTGIAIDDFALDPVKGIAYVAAGSLNSVLSFSVGGGEVKVLYGGVNSTALPGPTSVQLGRGLLGQGKVYVSTDGGLAGPVNGVFTEGGKVVEIEVGL